LIERFAWFGEFHFFKAIRDENGDLQSLQGFVCHLHYLLHQAQNDSLHLRRTGPTVVDKHQIFIDLNQSCHPREHGIQGSAVPFIIGLIIARGATQ
jgi:hypothetical protein